MADLDHFEEVNDRYRHAAGDAVLQGVAESLLRSLRATDTAGRAAARSCSWRSHRTTRREALSSRNAGGSRSRARSTPVPSNRRSPSRSASAWPVPGCLRDPDQLVAAADKALYRAKDEGRSRVEVYEG